MRAGAERNSSVVGLLSYIGEGDERGVVSGSMLPQSIPWELFRCHGSSKARGSSGLGFNSLLRNLILINANTGLEMLL